MTSIRSDGPCRVLFTGRFLGSDDAIRIAARSGCTRTSSPNSVTCRRPLAIDAPITSKRRESFATGNGAVCTVCCPAL
jgi:hypothetical protein